MFYRFVSVKRIFSTKEQVTNRTFMVAFVRMSDQMSTQARRVPEYQIAMIAFMLFLIGIMFDFPVIFKRFLVFERLLTVMTGLARFCCMHGSYMSSQFSGGHKCLLALIAFVSISRVPVSMFVEYMFSKIFLVF